jgi:hypothetical protein
MFLQLHLRDVLSVFHRKITPRVLVVEKKNAIESSLDGAGILLSFTSVNTKSPLVTARGWRKFLPLVKDGERSGIRPGGRRCEPVWGNSERWGSALHATGISFFVACGWW